MVIADSLIAVKSTRFILVSPSISGFFFVATKKRTLVIVVSQSKRDT
jgi:hypothetical protein